MDEHQGRDPIFGQSETVAELFDRTFDLLRGGRILAGRRLERWVFDGQPGRTRYRRRATVSLAILVKVVFSSCSRLSVTTQLSGKQLWDRRKGHQPARHLCQLSHSQLCRRPCRPLYRRDDASLGGRQGYHDDGVWDCQLWWFPWVIG